VEQADRNSRNLLLQANSGTWENCKLITAWHQNCAPVSCAIWM